MIQLMAGWLVHSFHICTVLFLPLPPSSSLTRHQLDDLHSTSNRRFPRQCGLLRQSKLSSCWRPVQRGSPEEGRLPLMVIERTYV
jgi:hypothetical protein